MVYINAELRACLCKENIHTRGLSHPHQQINKYTKTKNQPKKPQNPTKTPTQ